MVSFFWGFLCLWKQSTRDMESSVKEAGRKSQVPPKQPHEVLIKANLRRTFLASRADGGEGWRVKMLCLITCVLLWEGNSVLKVTVSASKKSQAPSTCPCKRNSWKSSNQLSDWIIVWYLCKWEIKGTRQRYSECRYYKLLTFEN